MPYPDYEMIATRAKELDALIDGEIKHEESRRLAKILFVHQTFYMLRRWRPEDGNEDQMLIAALPYLFAPLGREEPAEQKNGRDSS